MIQDDPVTCPSSFHCVVQAAFPEASALFVGCCGDMDERCYIPQACNDAAAATITSTSNTTTDLANLATITCAGDSPSCVTYLWTEVDATAFGCDVTGGTKDARSSPKPRSTPLPTSDIGPTDFTTTYSPTQSLTTSFPLTPSSGGGKPPPGESLLYGFTETQRIGVIVACSLAVTVFGGGDITSRR
ncbi:hypothetical protein B0H66DRAFT_618047 [Apodospora peruviana]|uniref:Uncharacterized protein n=1 Tax=Apodospora peruviana TaxID=516989 RepID=A0AAE0IKV6_9PEZI|nr:hypothetical protein B0H66DRAFT_618047 [Apodospora peruviana]